MAIDLQLLRFVAPALALAIVSACANAPTAPVAPDDPASTNDEYLRTLGKASPPWLYEGPLPALESPKIVVSITGHTVRVTGLLPVGFDAASLPGHAEARQLPSGRDEVTVVYPIATGKWLPKRVIHGALLPAGYNNVPGHYDHLNVRPYRPNDGASGDKARWGGFPFLNYHDSRRFAFHGPIDYVRDEGEDERVIDDWRLVRGRVSNGCQRMQGEHVLELTQMLGFDMGVPHKTTENGPDKRNHVEGKYIDADVTILAEPAFDVVVDDVTGATQLVDVDYPRHPSAPLPPRGALARVYPTWDANVQTSWACAVAPGDEKKPALFDGAYCARAAR